MEWTRSETLALAMSQCTQCHGMGLRAGRGPDSAPCNCVFRTIFRLCFEQFRLCLKRDKPFSRAVLEYNPRSNKRQTFGLKEEEYIADFCSVSRRSLTDEEYLIFRYHFLLGADWKLCCRKLGMDRGSFFHMVYRIQQRLGRRFRELQPYPLFPLDEYFNGTMRNELPEHPEEAVAMLLKPKAPALSDVVPLRRVA
jgi:hypothetical protein